MRRTVEVYEEPETIDYGDTVITLLDEYKNPESATFEFQLRLLIISGQKEGLKRIDEWFTDHPKIERPPLLQNIVFIDPGPDPAR